MKLRTTIVAIAAILLVAGCATKPLVIQWPNVQVKTNLPLSSNGVVVSNTVSGVTLTIKKRGHYGTSMIVRGMPTGESILVPADPLIRSQTFTITVTAYDSDDRYVGMRSREFSFSNSGYHSKTKSWDVRRSDLRQR